MAGTSSDTGCKQDLQGKEIVKERRNHLKQTLSYERFIFTLSNGFPTLLLYIIYNRSSRVYSQEEDSDSLLVSFGCSLKELM